MQCSSALHWPAYHRSVTCLPSCINLRKHNCARPPLLQRPGQTPGTPQAIGSWGSHHLTERRTPIRCSNSRFIRAASSGNSGILQLGQLTQPSALQNIWQDDIQQSCHAAWRGLRELALRQLSIHASQSSSAARSDAEQQHPVQQTWPEQFLLELDSLLGTLQQVLLICGLLKDHHAKQEWQAAAAAVFIAARTLEQDICSDTLLQQGLLMAEQQLIQQQQHSSSSSHPERSTNPAAAAAETPTFNHLLLSKTLIKHMQLEGLNPGGFAGRATSPNPGSTAQILSLQEQRSILSGLQAEHRVLLTRMQELLSNPAAAPVVQMDADSRAVLLQQSIRAGTHAAAAAAGDGNSDLGPQVLAAAAAAAESPTQAAAAVEGQLIDVVLDRELIQQVLQGHPDADVRSDVYSCGVLQQLDKLLLMWKDLAEIRRRIASNQGHSSYADFVLQHSLLGSHAAAVAVCEQIAAALQPAAHAAAQKLLQEQRHQLQQQQQQQQQQMGGQDESEATAAAAAAADLTDDMHVQGSDLAYLLHQERLELITTEDLQQLQPYLQFEHVMTGFDKPLQLSLGLSLTARPAAAGEVWNDRVLVYDLYDLHDLNDLSALTDLYDTLDLDQLPPLQQQQQAGREINNTHAAAAPVINKNTEGISLGSKETRFNSTPTTRGHSSSRLLGTFYIDPLGGFSAQMLLYGSQYQGTAQLSKQQQQQQQQPDAPGCSQYQGTALLSKLQQQQQQQQPPDAPGGSQYQGTAPLNKLQPDAPEGISSSTASQSLSERKASRSSSLECLGPTPVPCAIALGLHSNGVLGGTHSQLALGLWELCHELGHAVNFILSANANTQQQLAADLKQHPPGRVVPAAAAPIGRLHHLHSAWLPLEVLELPSTLFEVFCMDSVCLQELCKHYDTGERLPDDLAGKFAAFMRHSHYHPVAYQRTVLGMLFDLQMSGITGRQLGRHAAHAVWQEIMTTEGLTSTPHVEATMQQVLTLPRLLVSSGQGYGYAIAYCLAQLLWPYLLQQVRQSLQTASQHKDKRGCGGTNSRHESNSMVGVHIRSIDSDTRAPAGTMGIWRGLLSSGVELSDVKTLVQSIVQIQEAIAGAAAVVEECEQSQFGAVKGSGWAAVGGACEACNVAQALQDCGLWPLEQSDCDAEDLLLVCLSCALRKLRCAAECNCDCQCNLCHKVTELGCVSLARCTKLLLQPVEI